MQRVANQIANNKTISYGVFSGDYVCSAICGKILEYGGMPLYFGNLTNPNQVVNNVYMRKVK